jgi:hypothetical protein
VVNFPKLHAYYQVSGGHETEVREETQAHFSDSVTATYFECSLEDNMELVTAGKSINSRVSL